MVWTFLHQTIEITMLKCNTVAQKTKCISGHLYYCLCHLLILHWELYSETGLTKQCSHLLFKKHNTKIASNTYNQTSADLQFLHASPAPKRINYNKLKNSIEVHCAVHSYGIQLSPGSTECWQDNISNSVSSLQI